MASANAQKVEQGTQSVQALIQAIAPEIASGSNGQVSSEEIATRLTDKLVELVGKEGISSISQGSSELVNEEGLPIIEITEPVDPTDLRTSASKPLPVVVEPLIPIESLPEEARAKLRARRDHILDVLEEEERQFLLAEKRQEVQRIMEGATNYKETSIKDKERNKAAKDMQKKMGRALLQNISRAKEQEREDQEALRRRDEEADKERRKSPSIKKKTVAFAESAEQINGVDSDAKILPISVHDGVSQAGLKRPTLTSQALLDRHPMKMNVVERLPNAQTAITKPTLPNHDAPDSDDESEPDIPPDSDVDAPELDEYDLDYAQQQREIVMEYYNKRGVVGKAAENSSQNYYLESDPSTSKPAISQFRANRLASAYDASVPSVASSSKIEPQEASARTIRKAIRTGKLDSDENLVGGEIDSASENENEGLQEVLELLRKGENLGPNGEYNHTISRDGPSHSSETPSQPRAELPPARVGSKISKFKISQAAAGRPPSSTITIPSHTDERRSASATPISHETRSSPKMETPSTLTAIVGERNPPASAPFSMIVDSPSFPQTVSSSGEGATLGPVTTMVIESPSFTAPLSRRPDRPPTILSTVKESMSINGPTMLSRDNDHPKKISRFKAERS